MESEKIVETEVFIKALHEVLDFEARTVGYETSIKWSYYEGLSIKVNVAEKATEKECEEF